MQFFSIHPLWLTPILIAIAVITLFLTIVWLRAKSQIRKISNKYRALVESFSDLVFLLDENGCYIDIIASKETLLVNKADHLKGRTIFEVMPQNSAQEIHQVIKNTLQLGPQTIEYKLNVLKGERIFEGRTSVLKSDSHFNSSLVVWVSRDITEKVEFEKNQKKLKIQLMQAQKMEAIAITAGGVAHDLNNLLSSIVVYPDFIREKLPQDNFEIKRYLDRIKSAGEQSASIVKDLLVMSRKSNRESQILDINKLIKEFLNSSVVDMLKSNYKNIRLLYEPIQSETLRINGSDIHMTKVLMNLIINAFESISGSGVVRVTTYRDPKNHVVIKISDTGKGISESQREQIFDPFYSDKNSDKSGTGLGLAVVWGIVQDHHGNISVESLPGEGSTFLLAFPEAIEPYNNLQNPTFTQQKSNSQHTTPPASRILIADDFEDQREVMGEALERLGHKVSTACDGREALSKILNEKFDLVFLDMKMGDDWDGLETYENILKVSPNQNTVIVTGHSEDERIKKALALGVREVATKPMNFHQIQALVERSLASKAPCSLH